MKKLLFAFVLSALQSIVHSSDVKRIAYGGVHSGKDAFLIVINHPSPEQQEHWCVEQCDIPKENRGPIDYDLYKKPLKANRGKHLKTISTKYLGTKERDVIGEGNCFWRAMAYWITGHEDNYMKIKEAVTRFVRENHHKFNGTGTTAEKFITDNGLDVDGYPESNNDVYHIISVLFKVHIYFLWVEQEKPDDQVVKPYWVHYWPGKDPNEELPSVLVRFAGIHFRIITDIFESETLTTPNMHEACLFLILLFPPSRAHLPEYEQGVDIQLILNPHKADVEQIKKLTNVQVARNEGKKITGEMVFKYINKEGKERPIKAGEILGNPPYNIKCGSEPKIVARMKNADKDVTWNF
ncbi:hypothetical protein DdX_19791 [Ditylenchus destructor]|uniref:OTU domain-containing protein n=1 Tax=Ditylenchus destructor TaxID=166010 RepID=A0AAD4MIX6_9BILA|nr:hypothetical protein DdX_19791 [Ditylenchus destructor]